MGRLIYLGSKGSATNIPQPISFITGANLPDTSRSSSPPSNVDDVEDEDDDDEPLTADGDWDEDIPPIRFDEYGRVIDPDEYRHEYRKQPPGPPPAR
jgi:hypothetical protein